MDPVSGQIRKKIPVCVADVRVHVNIKDIMSVCQSTDRVISLADHCVVPAAVGTALFFRDMHDRLNVDQGSRLILPDQLQKFSVFLIIHVSIADPQLIYAQGHIYLSESAVPKDILDSGIPSFFVIVCEPQFLVKNVVYIDGFLGEERCVSFKTSVFAQSYCPGISDEQSIAEIGRIHGSKFEIDPVFGKYPFGVRVVLGIIGRQKCHIDNVIVLCLHDRIAYALGDRIRSCADRVRGDRLHLLNGRILGFRVLDRRITTLRDCSLGSQSRRGILCQNFICFICLFLFLRLN